ncbi:hypothetical protein A7985_05215 [Pseudoalteromonas luteoviolacea]|uniref:Uncharacterized protein n=1 Tax=Pseudoalteromonas luteoviolacea TaxID=43657 RepID=A0A1C0TVK3_9GAMM|nr:BMA_0021/BMA_0022 family TOMM bacteriocin [Pseudoalteromonas luteoviolacea]OCQ23345.1 hypothetical protein A7985_05215 [Pseudoalteromonas luteoviolacea]
MNENNDIDFLSFRSAFISAIAKSWTKGEEHYRSTFEEMGSKKSTAENTNGILRFLEEYPATKNTRFINPWRNLSIQFIYPDLEYDEQLFKKWKGFNSGIIINIPKKPDNMENAAELLARYYNVFPTFYGLVKNPSTIQSAVSEELGLDSNTDENNDEQFVSSEQFKRHILLNQHINKIEKLYDVDMLSYTDEELRYFSAITMEAISLCWTNEDFKAQLCNEAEWQEAEREGKQFVSDKSSVLSEWLDYKNPWNMNIMFKYAEDFDLTENLDDNKLIPNNVVALAYPKPPVTQGNSPVALADYNHDGSVLPFSCS